MKLKYKETIYEPIFEKTNDTSGLREGDFWVNIKLKVINDEINFNGELMGMSFKELVYWNNINKKYLDGLISDGEKVSFIRKLGELIYYPSLGKVIKNLYLFKDVNKFYSIEFNNDELEMIYENNRKFIDKYM